jgi:hypothetical protein
MVFKKDLKIHQKSKENLDVKKILTSSQKKVDKESKKY